MSSWIWCESNGRDSVCGMVVNCFNLGEGGEMLGFCIEGSPLVRRGRQAPLVMSASSICGNLL